MSRARHANPVIEALLLNLEDSLQKLRVETNRPTPYYAFVVHADGLVSGAANALTWAAIYADACSFDEMNIRKTAALNEAGFLRFEYRGGVSV